MQALSLLPRPDALHVRAGQIVRVVQPHDVCALAKQVDPTLLVRAIEVDDRPMRPAPTGRFVQAKVGDLAVEVREVVASPISSRMAPAQGPLVGYAYIAGAAATFHRRDIGPDMFTAARVERLVKIERASEEIGLDADEERIGELQGLITAEMRRAREADLDLALLDLEVGAAFETCAQALAQMWSGQRAGGDQRAPGDRTCHLVAMVYRNRKIARARTKRGVKPGVAVVHSMPPRHGGWPPVSPFLAELVLTATLPS